MALNTNLNGWSGWSDTDRLKYVQARIRLFSWEASGVASEVIDLPKHVGSMLELDWKRRCRAFLEAALKPDLATKEIAKIDSIWAECIDSAKTASEPNPAGKD